MVRSSLLAVTLGSAPGLGDMLQQFRPVRIAERTAKFRKKFELPLALRLHDHALPGSSRNSIEMNSEVSGAQWRQLRPGRG